uniref:Uncharacterized protein n=1 Tax=Anguilla anguilla TaxID=7936 RepID=A0A0E9V9P1_ANGAN
MVSHMFAGERGQREVPEGNSLGEP